VDDAGVLGSGAASCGRGEEEQLRGAIVGEVSGLESFLGGAVAGAEALGVLQPQIEQWPRAAGDQEVRWVVRGALFPSDGRRGLLLVVSVESPAMEW
jgi:hypothetical protein